MRGQCFAVSRWRWRGIAGDGWRRMEGRGRWCRQRKQCSSARGGIGSWREGVRARVQYLLVMAPAGALGSTRTTQASTSPSSHANAARHAPVIAHHQQSHHTDQLSRPPTCIPPSSPPIPIATTSPLAGSSAIPSCPSASASPPNPHHPSPLLMHRTCAPIAKRISNPRK